MFIAKEYFYYFQKRTRTSLSQPENNEEAMGTPASTHDEAVRPDATPSPESVAKSKPKGTNTKRKRKTTPSEGPSSGTEHSIAGLFRVNVTMMQYLFGVVFLTLGWCQKLSNIIQS